MHEIRSSVPPVRRSMELQKSCDSEVLVGASPQGPLQPAAVESVVGLKERTAVTQAYNARIPLANTLSPAPTLHSLAGANENMPMVSR